MSLTGTVSDEFALLHEQVRQRDQFIEALKHLNQQLEGRIDALEHSLVNYSNENSILKRRLFGTKSERSQTSELQLTLEGLLKEQEALEKELEEINDKNEKDLDDKEAESIKPKEPVKKPRPRGRRCLESSNLPRTVIDITDAELEKKGKLIDYENSYQLMYIKGNYQVLQKRIAKYEIELNGEKTVLSAMNPPSLFPKSLAHSSTIAHITVEKFSRGVPLYRQEQHAIDKDSSLDRGTMCRYMEQLGNSVGPTIVQAMWLESINNASVIATDATGGAILPEPVPGEKQKQACKKGHFFVLLADADHVLYRYSPHHRQEFVAELFAGFKGFVQSDASSVYNILERGPPMDNGEASVSLTGCWTHGRRYFHEAAVCHYAIGVQGLIYIQKIYEADNQLRHLSNSNRKKLRKKLVLPLANQFFEWVDKQFEQLSSRDLASRAIVYARNQKQKLLRIIMSGNLPLDNNRSERALRLIVIGRKNWLFYGSDVHAEAAAAIFSLIASCRLHKLEPEAYLDDIIRVLPYWPKERYLELSPKHWRQTRARLLPEEIDSPLSTITVPAPLDCSDS